MDTKILNYIIASFVFISAFAIISLIAFGFWYITVWVICWSFGIAFSVNYVFGVWLIYLLLSSLFKRSKKE